MRMVGSMELAALRNVSHSQTVSRALVGSAGYVLPITIRTKIARTSLVLSAPGCRLQTSNHPYVLSPLCLHEAGYQTFATPVRRLQ